MVTRHVLSDGTRVTIRPIAASDKQELQDGLHRLSDETVQRRFLVPKARFTKAELRYLTEVDGHDHVALVAESDRWPGMVVAVARYVRLDDDPDTAETAIVVADALQGLGLGTLLAERLAAIAVAPRRPPLQRRDARRQPCRPPADGPPARTLADSPAGRLTARLARCLAAPWLSRP